ncbi:Uncharacterised protein [Vibrio cholerae]|nr:Uncharacterised protein [Vibrio cholerae]
MARHHHHGIEQEVTLIHVQYRKSGNLADGRIQRAAFKHHCMQHIGSRYNRIRVSVVVRQSWVAGMEFD